MGRKPDMIIQAVGEGNWPLEFGACKTASYYDGTTGKKYDYESRLKLPKIPKDMLFNLCEYANWDKKKPSILKLLDMSKVVSILIRFVSLIKDDWY